MKYILTQEEFALLLSACKIRSLYCFGLPQSWQRPRLVAAMHRLYQNGFLVSQGETLAPAPALAGMLGRMQAARRAVKLTFSEGSFPQSILYAEGPESAVVLEHRLTQWEDHFALKQTAPDPWAEELAGQLLPQVMPLESLETDGNIRVQAPDELEQMACEGEFLVQLDVLKLPENQPLTQLKICRWRCSYWLIEGNEQAAQAALYSKAQLKQQLLHSLGEEQA